MIDIAQRLIEQAPCQAAGVREWESGADQVGLRWPVEEPPSEHRPPPRTECTPLLEAVYSSVHLLELPEDFDQEGSPGYSAETWRRAIGFLLSLAGALHERDAIALPRPKILPAGAGSIDLHWKSSQYELLVNVPANPQLPVEYYGDNARGQMPIESHCPATAPDRKLVAWVSLVI